MKPWLLFLAGLLLGILVAGSILLPQRYSVSLPNRNDEFLLRVDHLTGRSWVYLPKIGYWVRLSERADSPNVTNNTLVEELHDLKKAP